MLNGCETSIPGNITCFQDWKAENAAREVFSWQVFCDRSFLKNCRILMHMRPVLPGEWWSEFKYNALVAGKFGDVALYQSL